MTTCQREQIGELILLGLIALAVAALAAFAIHRESAGESAAWSAILMAIVNAIKERMSSRTVDRMGDQLAVAQPRSPQQAENVKIEGDHVVVEETRK
ncbi:MAG TPA: hypothetical protein PL098_00160 [Brevundimonas diminuta]|nr:hypothetical protein [Brevundimonas diminuta]HRL23317.1 hypothetical protein [Brevundimonas diminuta]